MVDSECICVRDAENFMMRGFQDPCFPFLVNVILFSLLHTQGHLGFRTEVKAQPHWLTEDSVASTGS